MQSRLEERFPRKKVKKGKAARKPNLATKAMSPTLPLVPLAPLFYYNPKSQIKTTLLP